MRAYLLRRLLALVPTLLFASLIVFVTLRLIPGDVIDIMLARNDVGAGKMDREQLAAALGLDRPMWQQYGAWLGGFVLHGDLGKSLWQGTPVTERIAARFPVTFELTLIALVTSLLLGIPAGVYAAMRQETRADHVVRSLSILLLAVPGFWLGTIVVVLPSIWWGWSPPIQYAAFGMDPLRNLQQMLLPGLILGASLSAMTMRLVRTMMLEVLRQDYIRTAWAKGLGEWRVVLRHGLRNALIPVISLVGLQVPSLLGGAVVMESIFAVPGIGSLMLEAVSSRDYPVIAGIFLVGGVAVMLINLAVDLSYGLLDPRIRRES